MALLYHDLGAVDAASVQHPIDSEPAARVSLIAPVRQPRGHSLGRRLAALPVATVAAIAGLTLLRFLLAATLPLSFDESYFWLWSKHLALSYYDHPPLIALAIRAGTWLFGDSELGVRFVPLLASVAASWAVFESAALALVDRKAAWMACLLFNTTLMVAAESMSATPDSLVLAAAALLLLIVTKLQASADGRWFIAAGVVTGTALFSKYTGFFLFASMGLWLVATTEGRRWLRTGWPYLGGVLALSFLAPTLYWNAQHDWISFKFQFGRVVAGKLTFAYLIEFVAAQIALASPFIAGLGAIGLARQLRRRSMPDLSFAAAMIGPALAYFLIHALHDRVQGNWPSFLYPALVLLATATIFGRRDGERESRLVRVSAAAALPVAFAILIACYLQAFFGVLPLGNRDPIARMTGVGFADVAKGLDEVADRNHAAALVTTKYATTGWLAFYRASQRPVIQLNEDYRWLSAPRAGDGLLRQPLLYIAEHPERDLKLVAQHFADVRFVAAFNRERHGIVIDRYYAYRLSGFHGPALGRIAIGPDRVGAP